MLVTCDTLLKFNLLFLRTVHWFLYRQVFSKHHVQYKQSTSNPNAEIKLLRSWRVIHLDPNEVCVLARSLYDMNLYYTI